jgi:predicted DNA-binding transcriptional regulator AlpA
MSQTTWTIKALAAYLKITPRTIRRLINTDQFPRPMKIGRHIRWTPQVIETFLATAQATDQAEK